METLSEKTSKMLIKESKEYLRQYHINLKNYTAIVEQDDDITATVVFTSKETGKYVYVQCFYNNTEILQAEVYL